MAVKKKLWKKTTKVIHVGKCRICKEDITNDMSFLSFYGGTHAHFKCDREEYNNKQKME